MQKNVLVIMCDQLRKDCLGCYGNTAIHTPNIDALAKESVQCVRNYAANPICMPNRLTLFSGMYPKNHGIWTNGLLIKDEGYTLMHHLQQNGYQTASIGKIHFEPTGCAADCGSKESNAWWNANPDADNFHGPFWGFDYIELIDNHQGIGGHMKKWFYAHGGKDEMFSGKDHTLERITGPDSVPKELHSSAFVGIRTCNYLTEIRDKNKPFFAVASFPDPHHPFTSPQECYDQVKYRHLQPPVGDPEDLKTRPARYQQQYQGAWDRSGVHEISQPNGISEELARERTLHTYAMIELIDEYVGKILTTLKEQGLWENTIVVFTSDHGELLGDHGLWTKGPFFYEGLISTPLLVKAPKMKAGICDEMISAVDFAPTLCDMLELPIPFYMDGISQKNTLLGGLAVREQCMLEYRNGYFENDLNHKVLITKDFKYALCQTGEEELTDLSADPQERKNIAADEQYSMQKQKMKEALLMEMLRTESKKPYQLSLA